MRRTSRFAILFGLFGLQQAGPLSAQDWIPLFNGQNLDGWRASEKPGSFHVRDGAIVCDGPRSHLFYTGKDGKAGFRNFEFRAEVMTRPGANSGVYFHTRFLKDGWPDKGFEVQVNNTHRGEGGYVERKKTASLYAIRNVYKQLVPDDAWFELRFRVEDRRVRIWLNGVQTVDYVEPRRPSRPAGLAGRILSSGTFALQCHDPKSNVLYRNLAVRILPDSLRTDPSLVPDTEDSTLIRMAAENYPLVDFHVHLKGDLSLEKALEKSRSTGIFYGIAPNCGRGFPIRTDAGVDSFLAAMKGVPAFLGMQAEGREWVKMFSPGAIDKFDYVFTDGMTVTDDAGRRMRLWIPEETVIGDPENFVEMLTGRIAGILENEPIDVYVNPLYLPEPIAGRAAELWTRERLERIVRAASRRGVAIEISDRLRLPDPAFIRMCKEAGLKFTMGSNNTDSRFGRLEWALRQVSECGLKPEDFFVPDKGLR